MTRQTSFWDRRRAAVQAEEVAMQRAAEADALERSQADKSDDELLAELDLPDPDTLQAGDDFAAFMARAVPAHLRRRALRKLWVSDPVLACLDDLVDYADDYTQAAAVTDFTTSYEVGKGLRRHVEAMARKAAESVADLVEGDEAPETSVVAEANPTPERREPPQAADLEPAVEDDAATAGPARRMTFRFEDQTA